MIDALMNRPCTIRRRTLGTVTDIATVCELQQAIPNRRSGELAHSAWTLFLPAGTPIAAEDQVVVGDLTYEVAGEPWEARDPRDLGRVGHIEVTLQRGLADNATLTLITLPSLELTRSGKPVSREPFWAGAAPCYLQRDRATTDAAGENVLDVSDWLWVRWPPAELRTIAAGADWQAAEVTVLDHRSSPNLPRTFTVDASEVVHAGAVIDSLRLKLSAERSS